MTRQYWLRFKEDRRVTEWFKTDWETIRGRFTDDQIVAMIVGGETIETDLAEYRAEVTEQWSTQPITNTRTKG